MSDGDISAVSSALRPDASAERGEARFVARLVWIVVFWSVVGGIAGALLGVAVVSAGIGGGGTLAIVLEIIGWVIFGHLIAGMWAGYALLADRSTREFKPEGGDTGQMSIVQVRCRDRVQIEHARELLDAEGATSVDVIAVGGLSRRVS